MSMVLFVLVGCGSSDSDTVGISLIDLAGKPVANATVILTDTTVAMGESIEAITDENGIANFSSLKSGVNYKMEVFVDDILILSEKNITKDVDFHTFTINQGAEIEKATVKIKVEDNNGNLLEDAKVTFNGVEKYTVITGIATFTDISFGKYTVKIEKAGFDVIEEEIEVTKEAKTMTFKLTVQVNKFTINYINAAEDYTDYSLEITSIDGIDKNILLKSKEDSTYGIYFEYTFPDFNVKSVGFAIKVGEDVVEEFTFENVKRDKTIWVKEGSNTVYTAKPVISTLTIKNDNELDIFYVNWTYDYNEEYYYNFNNKVDIIDENGKVIGDQWGIKAGDSVKNIVEPKSAEDRWDVYFYVEELDKVYKTKDPVVVAEGEDVIFVIDLEDKNFIDVTDFVEQAFNLKRSGMTLKEYLKNRFENRFENR